MSTVEVFDGAEMRRRRQRKKLSTAQLAVGIDRCAEAVSGYELGLRDPPLRVLVAICRELGCRPNDLVLMPVKRA